MLSFRSIAAVVGTALLAACGGDGVQDITAPAPTAAVKYFNFGINAPNVNFYANDTKMTAISSTTGAESNVGTAYGSAGAGALYVGLNPGSYTLSGRITTATDNGVSISNTPATIAEGKYYSYYISGAYDATTKKAEAFLIEDPIPADAGLLTYVRFVNAIPNAGPQILYAKNTVTGIEYPIGSAVAYKSGGAFTSIPSGIYDISTRAAGSSTALITRTAVSFGIGRIYTISSRGDMTVVSTTATNRPFLDNTANR